MAYRDQKGKYPEGDCTELIEVGVGEFAVGVSPACLMTPALGSCVGVILYDPVGKRGGLAHVMLPKPLETSGGHDLDRFAEVAIPKMVEQLRALGTLQSRIVAKIAGGSAMFRADSILASVGERNVAEVKRQLALLRIPVLAEDTGGSHARTVELHLDTGVVVVRSYAMGAREL